MPTNKIDPERRNKLCDLLGDMAYTGFIITRDAGYEEIGEGDQFDERWYERIEVKIPPSPRDDAGKKAFSPDFAGKKFAEFGFEIKMIYTDEDGMAMIILERFIEEEEYDQIKY